MNRPDEKPELLAPAGNWDCVHAAIENGADAVYFGLDCGFNARARAANFHAHDLPRLMQELHRRNVAGYVTLNTLVFSDELEDVERLIRLVAAAHVDALLVQDIGVARLAREICPALPLHASTQMTMTSGECIALAEQLECDRVVLARELSLDEISDIRKQTRMPLEVFVHGALCVAYSGQCLTSESLGGRSANRGQCAQACRLSYDVVSDGQDVDLGEQKYLLSPQDLAAYELTPKLLELGIRSFKIEGRLKTPEYVANITRHYRQAIDAGWDGHPLALNPVAQYEMEMSFSRGFSPGWLQGCDHKMLVPGMSSAKRGVLAGRVEGVHGRRVRVDLCCDVQAGDGLVFEGDREHDGEQGGRVFAVYRDGEKSEQPLGRGVVELVFGRDTLELHKILPGLLVWKTDDPKLNRRLRKTYVVSDPVRRVPLALQVECRAGSPLTVHGHAANGASCSVSSEAPLEVARKHVVTREQLAEQFGRLGGTIYELDQLDVQLHDGPMVPLSVMGQMRRAMVRQLEAFQPKHERALAEGDVLPRLRHVAESTCSAAAPTLLVMCRSLEQVTAASELGCKQLYAELQDIRQYSEAVSIASMNGAQLMIATPRIQKPGEMGIFRSLEKHQPRGFLIRNYAGLRFFHDAGFPVVSDFAMNATNELTVDYLLSEGASRVTASYDLNREQLLELVGHVMSEKLEVVIHQHMPMFHMEHCVFCAVLSPGTNKTNCGRPCDELQVELRDRIGMEHPLTADVGCRNTLYNAVPQSSAEIVHDLNQRGVVSFRVELLREGALATENVIGVYRDLLSGRRQPSEVWRELNAMNRVGVTRGTLEKRDPLAII